MGTSVAGVVAELMTDPADLHAECEALLAAGDSAVQEIEDAVLRCAAGTMPGPWWQGAPKLCRLLGQIGTPAAERALLRILNTDSRVVEFDRVRAAAAEHLRYFAGPSLVEALVAAAQQPHAPVLAIKAVLEVSGGKLPVTPALVIAEAAAKQPADAVPYLLQHALEVEAWPAENRCGYYCLLGSKMERWRGTPAALPYFAASLASDPQPDDAAWLAFPRAPRTPESARRLARRYPLAAPARAPAAPSTLLALRITLAAAFTGYWCTAIVVSNQSAAKGLLLLVFWLAVIVVSYRLAAQLGRNSVAWTLSMLAFAIPSVVLVFLPPERARTQAP